MRWGVALLSSRGRQYVFTECAAPQQCWRYEITITNGGVLSRNASGAWCLSFESLESKLDAKTICS